MEEKTYQFDCHKCKHNRLPENNAFISCEAIEAKGAEIITCENWTLKCSEFEVAECKSR